MTDNILDKCCCENRLDPIGMVHSKEELIRGLKICASFTCDNCPYFYSGCSSSMASDALLVIKDLERRIQSSIKYIQTIEAEKEENNERL